MKNTDQNYPRAVQTEIEMVVECEIVDQTRQNIFEKENTMTEFADKTYATEAELRRFLATLTPDQLAITEIILDDETFIVFYPLLPAKPGHASEYHFDTDYPRPTVSTVDVPELVGVISDRPGPVIGADRESDLAVLLASVRS